MYLAKVTNMFQCGIALRSKVGNTELGKVWNKAEWEYFQVEPQYVQKSWGRRKQLL